MICVQCVHTFTMIKHSKLTSALDQLTTILASSSEEPLYIAVVEQYGTGGGTVGDHVNVNACAAAITTRSYTSKMYTHTTPVFYVIDILQASAVTGYTRGTYSIRSRGAAEASN